MHGGHITSSNLWLYSSPKWRTRRAIGSFTSKRVTVAAEIGVEVYMSSGVWRVKVTVPHNSPDSGGTINGI